MGSPSYSTVSGTCEWYCSETRYDPDAGRLRSAEAVPGASKARSWPPAASSDSGGRFQSS